jgi:hypothetical protein
MQGLGTPPAFEADTERLSYQSSHMNFQSEGREKRTDIGINWLRKKLLIEVFIQLP